MRTCVKSLASAVFSSRLLGEKSPIVSIAYRDPAQVAVKKRLCRDEGVIVNQRAGRLRSRARIAATAWKKSTASRRCYEMPLAAQRPQL